MEQEEQSQKIKEVWADFDKAASSLVDQLQSDLNNKQTNNLSSQKESLKLLNDQVKDVSTLASVSTGYIVGFKAPDLMVSPRGGVFEAEAYLIQARQLITQLEQIEQVNSS